MALTPSNDFERQVQAALLELTQALFRLSGFVGVDFDDDENLDEDLHALRNELAQLWEKLGGPTDRDE